MKKTIFVFLTICIVAACVLAAMEAAFRMTGAFMPSAYRRSKIPDMNFEMKPGIRYRVGGSEVSINGEGYRDIEWNAKKPAGTIRVACIGDSMTMAVELKPEETYMKVLENKLNDNGMKTEFMNFGVGGYNTAQELLVYKHSAAKYRPDLVIVQYTLNDLTEIYPVYVGDSSVGKLKVFLGDHLRVYRFLSYLRGMIKDRTNAYNVKESGESGIEAPVSVEFMRSVYSPEGKFFRDWKSAAAGFGKLSKEGPPVIFVIFPWAIHKGMEQGTPYPYYMFHRQVEAELEREGIPYVDVTPELAKRGNLMQFWAAPGDFHLNAAAHRIIAEQIEPGVLKALNSKKR